MPSDHKRPGLLLIFIVIALAIKLSLFAFAAIHVPQSKIMPDSVGYLKTADMLAAKCAFALQDDRDRKSVCRERV
jgi:hypothetical protein